MAWTTPKTWSSYETVTAAMMNTYIRDNQNYLYDRTYLVPLATPLTSTSWDGDAFSTTAKTKIDLSAVFGAPAGIKAALIRIVARDSGSSGFNAYVGLAPNNTDGSHALAVFPAGLANNSWDDNQGIVPCDENGDIYYQISASGSGTMDVVIEIWGYWL